MITQPARWILAGFLSFANAGWAPATPPPAILSVVDFGASPDSGRDAGPAFRAALEAAAKHPEGAVLRLPKGRYDFFSESATQRICFASNCTEGNQDGMRHIAVDVRNLKNLTIDGQGSTLMMRGKLTMLVADACENFTLQNVMFDFLRPTMSEATVLAQGPGWVTFRVHPDSKYRIIAGKRIQWIGEGWQCFHNVVQIFDPKNATTWRSGDPFSGATAITELEPGVVKVEAPKPVSGLEIGRTIQCRLATRDEIGIWLNRSRNVAFHNVAVRYMHGFGILGQLSENISVDHLSVAPQEGSGRTAAAFADILHFSMCKGKISITDSKLSAAHDDAVNIHGIHFKVVEKPAPNQIVVAFAHHQTRGFQAFFPGDGLVYAHKDLSNFGETRVAAAEVKSDRQTLLTLDQPVPDEALVGSDCVENTTWTPGVEIRNCEVSSIPTRGFLVTTRGKVVIANNRFLRTTMNAILVSNDAASWFESGPVRDLTIEHNRFEDCGEPVVRIENGNHSGVRIMDNEFLLKGRTAAQASGVSGFLAASNRVSTNDARLDPNRGTFGADKCPDAVIEKNTREPRK